MILEIFKNSFEYTYKNKKIFTKLGTISLLSFLIFPIIMLGYSYRVIKIALNGMMDSFDPLPQINNYKRMFKDGIKILIPITIYTVIPILILYILCLYF